MTLRVFEGFSGVGSQRMALRNLGVDFEVVGISEVDKYALLAYDAIHNEQDKDFNYPDKEEMIAVMRKAHIGYNFSNGNDQIPRNINDIKKLYRAHINSHNFGDICLIDESSLPDFDLFTYSFPCKNISIAGKQAGLEEGSGTQSSLVWECKRIIEAKKPTYLMMENVFNLVSDRHFPFFQQWIKVVEDMGYVNKWMVMNSINHNSPQQRKRVIMISILKEHYNGYELPVGSMINKRFVDILETDVDSEFFVTNPNYQDYIRSIVLNSDTVRKDTVVRLGGLYDKNGVRRQAGAIWDKYGLAPTLDTCQGGYRQPLIVDKGGVRKITPKEAWRMMGYTDEDFEKAKEIGKLSNSKLYERAGRGIVVPMLEDIFRDLFCEE